MSVSDPLDWPVDECVVEYFMREHAMSEAEARLAARVVAGGPGDVLAYDEDGNWSPEPPDTMEWPPP